jgi:hypothetical protein
MANDQATELAPSVRSRADFIRFLDALHDDFRANGHDWENTDLASFLEALRAYASDIDGYYKNFKIDVDPSIASWRVFAEMLCGARIYE